MTTFANTTGVPNKYYRGPRQILPGCPASLTGVPDKDYRGPQQILPGAPTNSRKKFLQMEDAVMLPCSSVLCYCYVC